MHGVQARPVNSGSGPFAGDFTQAFLPAAARFTLLFDVEMNSKFFFIMPPV
jgi:hypothetical protein